MRRPIILVLAIATLMSGASASTVSAKSPSQPVGCRVGVDLQESIDTAPPGARLVIYGTCRGQFTIKRDLVLVGGGPLARLRGTNRAVRPLVTVAPGARVTIRGLVLEENRTSDAAGGAIDNRGRLLLVASSVRNNTARRCGAIRNRATMVIRDSLVSNNGAEVRVGGVCNAGAMLIRDSALEGNSARKVGQISSNGTLTVVNTTIRRGMADGDATGIYSSGRLTILDSRIQANTGNGPTIRHTGQLRIRGSVVKGNRGFLGAIRADGDALIVDSKIIDNQAEEGAGGIAAENLVLRRSVVRGNDTAVLDGGGMVVLGSAVVGKSRIEGNSTGGVGGGILNLGELRVHGSTVSGNSAAAGGGIANVGGGGVRLDNTVFESNNPTDCSGC